jgi:hypothetical protein
MFIVATATFQILYTLIVLDHDRRKIIHFGVSLLSPKPDASVTTQGLSGSPPHPTAFSGQDRGLSHGDDRSGLRPRDPSFHSLLGGSAQTGVFGKDRGTQS